MYYLRLLDGLSLEGPAGPVSGPAVQRRQLALLALLGAAGETGLSRDRLIGYLWPESDDARARHLLRDSLYRLRRELGEDAVLTVGEAVRLNPEVVWCDVGAFRSALERGALEEAVGQYRGPFLSGFHVRDVAEYERWADAERQRLGALYEEALESLARGAEELGDYPQAVGWWRRLCAHDRYNTRFVVSLMEALAAAGDPANALQQASEHEAVLREELGEEAASEFRALAEQFKQVGFPARVERSAAQARNGEVTPAAADEFRGGLRKAPVPERRKRRASWRMAGAAVGTLSVVAIAWLVLGPSVLGERVEVSRGDRKTVAVLPLINIGGDPENEFYSDGITIDIINRLSTIDDIHVISSTSVMRYKNTTKNLREIGEELGVSAIVEGGVQRVGDRVRISVQLIDARTDQHLWVEQYNRELTDVFEIQSDVAQNIATALHATLNPAEERVIEVSPKVNPEAYEYYLRGRAERERYPYSTEGIRYLEMAVGLDPDFSPAWAELAIACLFRAYNRLETQLRKRGIEALDQAIKLAPDAFETLVAQAYYDQTVTQEPDRALERLRRAEVLRPNDAYLHRQVGVAQRYVGRWDEALTSFEKAAELDPLDSRIAGLLADTYRLLGRFELAERYYDRAIVLEPSRVGLKFGFLLRGRGDTIEARELSERHPGDDGAVANEGAEESRMAQLDYLRRDYDRSLRFYLSQPMSRRLHGFPVWYLVQNMYYLTNKQELLTALADSLIPSFEAQLQEAIEAEAPVTVAILQCDLGLQYAHLKDRKTALSQAEKCRQAYPVQSDHLNYAGNLRRIARIYVRTGDYERAIDQLEKEQSVPHFRSVGWYRINPIYDPLRDHPRFQALLAKYE